MKLYTVITLLIFSLTAISQENSKTKLFKTSRQSFVVTNDSVDLDKFNDFIIIPEGKRFRKYFEKIGYFKEAISYKTLVKRVKDEKDGTREGAIYTEYYNYTKRCLNFFLTLGQNNMVELCLTMPDQGCVFAVRNKSTTNIIGINAGNTTYPDAMWNSMMNELVEYIRSNSKTYNR